MTLPHVPPRRGRAFAVPAALLLLVTVAFGGTACAQVSSEYTAAPKPPDKDHLFGLKYGDLAIEPSVALSEVYDSNIFLTDPHPNSDFITNIVPGIALRYQSDRIQASVASSCRFAFFAVHPEADAIEPYGSGRFKVFPLQSFYVTWGGYFQHTEDPIEQVFASRLPIDQFSYYGGLGYKKDHWDAEVLYEHLALLVDEEAFNFVNYEVNQVRAKGGYVINEHWKALVGFVAGHTDYIEPVKEDNVFHEGTVGAQWLPSEKFGILAEIGYRSQDYDSGSGIVTFRGDYRAPVARITARWLPTKQDSFVLAYSHRPEESVFSNYSTNNRYQLTYRHEFDDRWSTRVSFTFQRAEEGDPGVAQEERDTTSVSTGVTYRVENGVYADLSYSHHTKYTKDDAGEFDDNQVSLGISVSF